MSSLDEWREWALEELFYLDADPCAAMILALIDEVRRPQDQADKLEAMC